MFCPNNLPQLRGDLFITDGGMETTFLFHEGMELPEFAIFPVLDRPGGGDAIRRWYRTYTAIAGRFHVGRSPRAARPFDKPVSPLLGQPPEARAHQRASYWLDVNRP